MAWRPGGQDPDNINNALTELNQAGSIDDLELLVEELPVINSPVFHAILRQEYLRLRNEHNPRLQHFEPKYEDLFMLLHFKIHEQLCHEVSLNKGVAHLQKPSFYAPPIYVEISGILQDKIPDSDGPVFNPKKDLLEIQREISSIVGRRVNLPEYKSTEGSHWNVTLVRCASCQYEYLSFRAYAVNLIQAVELEKPIREGRINNGSCPKCGEELCFPLRVWIQEEPGVSDALAALSCIWRISENLLVYQPPPGTPRIEDNDRILEVRCMSLEKNIPLSIPKKESEGNEILSYAVAYSIEELRHYIKQVNMPEDFSVSQMSIAIEELSRKVQSRVLPLYEAEELLSEITKLNPSWPLTHPGDIRECGGLYYNYLFQSLIGEGLAEVRHQPEGVRAIFAAATSSGYLALNEVGLAEAAVARAEDLLANIPQNEPNRKIFEAVVLEARKDIAAEVGDVEQVESALESLSSLDVLQGSEIEKRLARQGIISGQALTYYENGEYANALEIFPQSVIAYRNLAQELVYSDDPNTQQILKSIHHILSGDLANWAAVLTDIADYLKINEKFNLSDSCKSDVSHLKLNLQKLRELIDSVTPVLNQLFPEGFDSNILLTKAQNLLLEALDLSKSVNGWEFAGIQAHRLATLARELGNDKEAVNYAEEAIKYAANAGDHVRIWTAYAFLADRSLEQGDGVTALGYLRNSAHELIKNAIGLAFYAEAEEASLTIGDAALASIDFGADAVEAIMVTESLKAAKTAASLISGIPWQTNELEQQPGIEYYNELTQQRELLKLSLRSVTESVKPLIERELQKLQNEIDQERKQLSLRSPQFSRWVDATDIDLSDSLSLRNRLQSFGAKTTFMGLLPVGDMVWIYMIWADGYLVSKQPYTSITEFVNIEEDEIDQSIYCDENYLQQLSTTLLEPLSERLNTLNSDDLLIISTYDQFSSIPFAALPYNEKYLCESVNIVLVQGVGIFEACVSRPELSLDSILAVGVSNVKQLGMDNLPGTVEEAEQIFQLFKSYGKQSAKIVESNTTIPKFKAQTNYYDIIHIACHALAESSANKSSRLLFAPDSEITDSGELTEDRIIYELILKSGCLINLAGCTTGLQSGFDSPLLGGLVPAFLIAGARSVVASLWKIDDDAVCNFQLEFYRLILTGKSPAKALTNLQRLSISGDLGAKMRDLYVWASFVLYGAG